MMFNKLLWLGGKKSIDEYIGTEPYCTLFKLEAHNKIDLLF